MGMVRIAFAGVSTHRLVARLARAVRSQRPGIVLEMSSQNFAQPAMKRLIAGDTDIALGHWDVIPSEVDARVAMRDSLVVRGRHALAGARRVSISQLSADAFDSLPPDEGSVLPDRLRPLARAGGFVADIVQISPDTQTALALVGAHVGCHLTLASVGHSASPGGRLGGRRRGCVRTRRNLSSARRSIRANVCSGNSPGPLHRRAAG